MKLLVSALLLVALFATSASAEIILPYRRTVGNWFVYQHDDGCAAVTESWGQSLYLDRSPDGWWMGSDAPIFRSGHHIISFNGHMIYMEFRARDGLATFNLPAFALEYLRMANDVDLEPEGRGGLFSLFQSGRAIDAINDCFANSGTEESRTTYPEISPFTGNCPEDVTVPHAGRDWTRVTFDNHRDQPVLIYTVSRDGSRNFEGPVMGRKSVDSYENAMFIVTDSEGNCLRDPIRVEGGAPVYTFE